MTTTQENISAEVSAFAGKWFSDLSEHVPAVRMEKYLATPGFEMVFPERTLRDLAEFRDWYAVVGAAYTAQSHTIEQLTATARGDRADVAVTVVWRATQTTDGFVLAMRARQSWVLRRVAGDPGWAVEAYRVDDMTPL